MNVESKEVTWGRLGLILVAASGLLVADAVLPETPRWRVVSGCLLVLLAFGAVALWVRANTPVLIEGPWMATHDLAATPRRATGSRRSRTQGLIDPIPWLDTVAEVSEWARPPEVEAPADAPGVGGEGASAEENG